MADDIRKTSQWREAENWYQHLQSTGAVFSIVGEPPVMGQALDSIDLQLDELLQNFSFFYPAWFHRGEFMLRAGESSKGESFMDRGFEEMSKILIDEDEFQQVLALLMGNLEKLLRFDLAAKYTEQAIRLFPETPDFYDELAFYILQLPKRDNSEALQLAQRALDMDPGNEFYINNLGWIQLIMGYLKEAEENFQQALSFDIDNPGALENLETVEYMREHHLNYSQYLLRPADEDQLKSFLSTGGFDDVADLCSHYNGDRLEAFKVHHLQKAQLSPHQLLDILQPLEFFIKRVEQSVEVDFPLWENIAFFHDNARGFIFQLLEGSDMVDHQFFDELRQGLTEFYTFLGGTGLADPKVCKQFIDHIGAILADFSGKLDRFYEISHDVTLDENQRDEKISSLFGTGRS